MEIKLVEYKRCELASQGDYVAGDDGELYWVKEWTSGIYMDGGNRCVKANLELASWDDVEEGWG